MSCNVFGSPVVRHDAPYETACWGLLPGHDPAYFGLNTTVANGGNVRSSEAGRPWLE